MALTSPSKHARDDALAEMIALDEPSEAPPPTCPECGAPEIHRAWGAGSVQALIATCGQHVWPVPGHAPPSDLAGLAAREAQPITEPSGYWVYGECTATSLVLHTCGRRLVGEDIGGPDERWTMDVGGRVVGSGARQASIALRWLLTGDGLT